MTTGRWWCRCATGLSRYALLREFDDREAGALRVVDHGEPALRVVHRRYRDLAEHVRRLGDRLIALHLSDYDGVEQKHELPGKGVIDWESFMQALRDVDYAGPFNYECKLEGDTPQERVRSLEKNFKWLCRL